MNRSRWFRMWVSANIQSISLWTVLTIHGLLLGWISGMNAPVFDEIGHLSSGLAHWQSSDFDLYRVNPPLMRMIAASPLWLLDPKTDWASISDNPYARSEFVTGLKFLRANGYGSFSYFTICRWAQIPVSIFGGWICFQWARELFETSSGFVALLLWCFCPNILAWGSTITPDIGGAAFGVAAAYSFWLWLKQPTWSAALFSGTALGLAELSKSTWVVLFALWPIIWLVWQHCVRKLPVEKPPARQLMSICIIGLYLLNIGYGFENSCQRLGRFRFISHALGGKDAHESPGNRFHGTWLEALPIPAPANYLRGIDVQKYDFEVGKWSYLRGEQKVGGWWYYYLYALVVKTPLGTLFLLGLACCLIVTRREYRLCFRDGMVLLIPAIAVLALVSSQTGFNRYLRYILPAAPFLYIFASRAGKAFELKRWLPKALCVMSLIAAILGSLSAFPHSMSFFNLAAGGPLGGPRHLLDANIDWGQDLLELKRFVEYHPEVSPIRLAYFGFADPNLAEFSFEPMLQSQNENGLMVLKPGWYAISVNYLFGYRHYDSDRPIYTHFRRFVPKYMAGYSIYIYHITPEALSEIGELPP